MRRGPIQCNFIIKNLTENFATKLNINNAYAWYEWICYNLKYYKIQIKYCPTGFEDSKLVATRMFTNTKAE